jgi:hypothetical protein
MCFLVFLESNTILPSYNRLPNPTEQHEIVRRVGALFKRADAIEREVDGGEPVVQAVDAGCAGEGVPGGSSR